MKNLLFAVSAFLAIQFTNAQQGFRYGIKIGVNSSNLKGDLKNAESLKGVNIGTFALIEMSRSFYFKPEIAYSLQGSASEYNKAITESITQQSVSKFNLAYINVPLVAKLNIDDSFSIEFGPQIGFLMSDTNETVISTYVDGELKTKSKFKQKLNPIDFGMDFGAGYNITKDLFLELRYNLGISNVIDTKKSTTEDFDLPKKMNNRVLTFSLAYSL